MLFNQLYLLVFFSIWVDEGKDKENNNKKGKGWKKPMLGERYGVKNKNGYSEYKKLLIFAKPLSQSLHLSIIVSQYNRNKPCE